MDIQLVFVHLGSPIPLHLILNMRRTSKLFPKNEIIFLTDRPSKFLKKNIQQKKIELNEEDIKVRDKYSFPRDFRNNFWFSSLARFSLIDKYMANSQNPVLHIESDVLLSSDFPLEFIGNLKQSFAYPIVSHRRAIASTLFIKDSKSASFLWNYAQKMVENNTLSSDMEILFSLHSQFPQMVLELPIAPQFLRREAAVTSNSESFEGFFDGHDFGVYVAGTNPWNSRGWSRLHARIPESLLLFDSKNIFFERHRSFISLRDNRDMKSYRLYSLHITNKNPLFFSFLTSKLAIKIWAQTMQAADRTFHPLVWLIMLFRFLSKNIKALLT